jgi:cytochrome c553
LSGDGGADHTPWGTNATHEKNRQLIGQNRQLMGKIGNSVDWTTAGLVPENEDSDQGGLFMISRRRALVIAPVVAVFALVLAAPPAVFGADAAAVYKKKCAACHGKEGEPNRIFAKQGVRSFKDAEWQKATEDAQVEEAIRKGKKGTMMASFEKQLTDEEVTALVAYIRTLGK